jgi:hypothetical protein
MWLNYKDKLINNIMNNLENIVNFEFPENEYELFTLNFKKKKN